MNFKIKHLFYFISNYSEFMRIYTNMFWIYLKICCPTAAHCRTARQPHTAALPHTAAHCRTLPHTAAHCPTAAHWCHTLLRALSHTGRCTATHIRVHCRTHPHTCTAAHIRRHPCGLPYTAALPHTAALAHSRAHCHILLRTPRTLHALKCRTPYTAHHTQSHTVAHCN
jgi:hypothetical protein